MSVRSRAVRGTGAGLVSLILLSGCGGGGEGDDVTLRFTWWGADHRHALTEEIVELFEEENPHITIDTEYTGWDEYWDSMATQAAGGNAPDVFQMDEQYLREYADRGSLLELDGVDVSDFEETAVENGMVEDSLYAITMGINAQVILANPVLFDEAGVELPDDETWTWDDFAETIGELNANLDDAYGFVGSGGLGMFQTWLRQQDRSISTEDGGVGFDVADAQEFFEFFEEIQSQEGAPTPAVMEENGSVGLEQSLAATGGSAFSNFWTNESVALTEMVGNELEIMRYPSFAGDVEDSSPWYKSSMYLSASSGTDHPEEAQMFIDFFMNSEEAAMVNVVERGIPPNTEIRDMVMDELEGVEADTVEFIDRIEPQVGDPEPITAQGLSDFHETINRYSMLVFFGESDPQGAAEDMVAEVEGSVGGE